MPIIPPGAAKAFIDSSSSIINSNLLSLTSLVQKDDISNLPNKFSSTDRNVLL
jgi:hypothetical protein